MRELGYPSPLFSGGSLYVDFPHPQAPRSHRPEAVHKPRGNFHPRVQAAGPEHFGIVCVDCAKARSKWKLADFYGRILVPPTVVEHNRPAFDAAIAQLRQAIRDHDLKDVLVAIERTGRYHHAPRRAFAAAGFETRIVHPFATKTLRQPADPGNKTDDTDLDAIHRAAVNGFALVEHVLDESWSSFRLLVRHRRDLVQKAAALRTQIREHLDAALVRSTNDMYKEYGVGRVQKVRNGLAKVEFNPSVFMEPPYRSENKILQLAEIEKVDTPLDRAARGEWEPSRGGSS